MDDIEHKPQAPVKPEAADSLQGPEKPETNQEVLREEIGRAEQSVLSLENELRGNVEKNFDRLRAAIAEPIRSRGGLSASNFADILVLRSFQKQIEGSDHKPLSNEAIQKLLIGGGVGGTMLGLMLTALGQGPMVGVAAGAVMTALPIAIAKLNTLLSLYSTNKELEQAAAHAEKNAANSAWWDNWWETVWREKVYGSQAAKSEN